MYSLSPISLLYVCVGNILLRANCDLKLCDFGLARGVNNSTQQDPHITEYVATRWYRAPEIMLLKRYGAASDIWSLGCIFGELLGRTVMFPGKDFQHQMPCIIRRLGPPPSSLLRQVSSASVLAQVQHCCQQYHPGVGGPEQQNPVVMLSAMFPGANAMAIDLLAKMLAYDPVKRITALEALRHPYLADLHLSFKQPHMNYHQQQQQHDQSIANGFSTVRNGSSYPWHSPRELHKDAVFGGKSSASTSSSLDSSLLYPAFDFDLEEQCANDLDRIKRELLKEIAWYNPGMTIHPGLNKTSSLHGPIGYGKDGNGEVKPLCRSLDKITLR